MNKIFLILTAGRLIQVILSLVSVKIFTSILAPSEIGEYYLIFTLISLFSQTLISPLGMFYNRHLHRWVGDGKILNHLFLLNIYLFLLSIIAMLVISILYVYFGIGEGIRLSYLNISVMSILIFLTLNQTLIGSLNMLSHRISFVIFTILTQVTTLTLSIILVKFVNPTAFSWIFGQIVALLIMSLTTLGYFARISGSKFNFYDSISSIQILKLKNVMIFTFPLFASSIFIWVQYQSYRLVIEEFFGLELLGLIGLGFAVASSIYAAVETLIHQLYLPIYYRDMNTNELEQRVSAWNQMAEFVFPIYLSAALLISSLSPFLMTIFTSDKYADAWQYVFFGVWIELFRSVTNTLSSVAQSEIQTRYLIKSYVGGATVAAVTTYACAYNGAYSIIPVALIGSGVVTVVIMYLEMMKLMEIKVISTQLVKTLLYSIPLFSSIFMFHHRNNINSSLAICVCFSCYVLIIQFKNLKRLLTKL